MKYRIVIKTEVSGKKWYYVQKRFLTYFWIYLSEVRDMSMSIHSVGFSTLKVAEKYIQYNVDDDYKKQQQKIVKKEIYKK
ncbi:hypothetical protein [Brevundimonas sp.]|jgi:hypothetical protein|uniref:hypothetical protein n=1 Tax=Brevundimonas sp. TaxID=1871086 RepID=UPI0037836FF8